jgi:DNA repair exonuclease SbcCD ATPase subunit
MLPLLIFSACLVFLHLVQSNAQSFPVPAVSPCSFTTNQQLELQLQESRSRSATAADADAAKLEEDLYAARKIEGDLHVALEILRGEILEEQARSEKLEAKVRALEKSKEEAETQRDITTREQRTQLESQLQELATQLQLQMQKEEAAKTLSTAQAARAEGLKAKNAKLESRLQELATQLHEQEETAGKALAQEKIEEHDKTIEGHSDLLKELDAYREMYSDLLKELDAYRVENNILNQQKLSEDANHEDLYAAQLPLLLSEKVVDMVVKLNLDFSSVGADGSKERTTFKDRLSKDLSDASDLPTTSFQVRNMFKGSVIVKVQVSPDPSGVGLDPADVVDKLVHQAKDPSSRLKSGVLTAHVTDIQLKTSTSESSRRIATSESIDQSTEGVNAFKAALMQRLKMQQQTLGEKSSQMQGKIDDLSAEKASCEALIRELNSKIAEHESSLNEFVKEKEKAQAIKLLLHEEEARHQEKISEMTRQLEEIHTQHIQAYSDLLKEFGECKEESSILEQALLQAEHDYDQKLSLLKQELEAKRSETEKALDEARAADHKVQQLQTEMKAQLEETRRHHDQRFYDLQQMFDAYKEETSDRHQQKLSEMTCQLEMHNHHIRAQQDQIQLQTKLISDLNDQITV